MTVTSMWIALFGLLAAEGAAPAPPNCPGGVISLVSAESKRVELPVVKQKRAMPSYPTGFKKSMSSWVIMMGTIDIDGNVSDVEVLGCVVKDHGEKVTGPDVDRFCDFLKANSVATFRQWKYKPPRLDGQPVCHPYTVRFDLKERR